jgi:Endosomal/lysosomal potassium channel TMEM175
VNAGEHLVHSILHEWPSCLAYVTSFLTIGVIWLQHSGITHALRAADATLYRLNLLVLLLALVPAFPTKLVSEFIGETKPERVAVVIYGFTLLALDLALTAFVRYAAEQRRLVKDEVEADAVEAALAHQPSFLLYGIAIGSASSSRRSGSCCTSPPRSTSASRAVRSAGSSAGDLLGGSPAACASSPSGRGIIPVGRCPARRVARTSSGR